MSDREEFEKRNPVPVGAVWNGRLSGYYCVSSPSVEHPFNDMWECFCDGWQSSRELWLRDIKAARYKLGVKNHNYCEDWQSEPAMVDDENGGYLRIEDLIGSQPADKP